MRTGELGSACPCISEHSDHGAGCPRTQYTEHKQSSLCGKTSSQSYASTSLYAAGRQSAAHTAVTTSYTQVPLQTPRYYLLSALSRAFTSRQAWLCTRLNWSSRTQFWKRKAVHPGGQRLDAGGRTGAQQRGQLCQRCATHRWAEGNADFQPAAQLDATVPGHQWVVSVGVLAPA